MQYLESGSLPAHNSSAQRSASLALSGVRSWVAPVRTGARVTASIFKSAPRARCCASRLSGLAMAFVF